METIEIDRDAFWAGATVLAPPRLAEEARAVGAHLREGELVFATSGSSGAPKWVVLTREALMASADAVNRHLEVAQDDHWLVALPLYHAGGFGAVVRSRLAGCRLTVLEGKWDAAIFAARVEDAGATICPLVPTQVADLVAANQVAPRRVRAIVVGGDRLPDETGCRARELGWPVLSSYGLTEAASQVATAPLSDLDSEFRCAPLPVLPVWEHRVNDVPRLELRGPALFDRYLQWEGGRIRAADPKQDGWFTTTDLVEANGNSLTPRGRADRQVKILGELVDVEELEARLRRALPPDFECGLVPVPDSRRGFRIVPVGSPDHGPELAAQVKL